MGLFWGWIGLKSKFSTITRPILVLCLAELYRVRDSLLLPFLQSVKRAINLRARTRMSVLRKLDHSTGLELVQPESCFGDSIISHFPCEQKSKLTPADTPLRNHASSAKATSPSIPFISIDLWWRMHFLLSTLSWGKGEYFNNFTTSVKKHRSR